MVVGLVECFADTPSWTPRAQTRPGVLCLCFPTRAQFKYMTTEIKEPFLRPEIVDRLTGMLTYNLAQLVGPKCTELKVRA